MAVIKSGATTDQWTIDPTSKAGRVTLYNTAGTVVGTTASPLVTREGIDPILTLMSTTFRTVGLASANHVIFTLENPAGSGRTLYVMRLTYQSEHTALSTALVSVVAGRTTALPTGGTLLDIEKHETSGDPVGVTRGATASDGGAATTITATLSKRSWTQFRQRYVTLAGYAVTPDNPVLPSTLDRNPLEIAAGAAIMVVVVTAALTTDHHLVNCDWEEA